MLVYEKIIMKPKRNILKALKHKFSCFFVEISLLGSVKITRNIPKKQTKHKKQLTLKPKFILLNKQKKTRYKMSRMSLLWVRGYWS